STMAAGTYQISATVGGTTVTRSMTIVDAVAPTLIASSPADDASSFAVADDLTLTFSKTVAAGTGFITLYRADGTVIERFDVASGTGDGGGSIAFGGTTAITLDPASNLTLATSYYVRIDGTAVIDSAGNSYAGIADSTTLNFATGSGVSAPSQVVQIDSMTKDSGDSATDFLTNDGTANRTVSGTLSGTLG